jgi:hypothetical protein
MLHVERRMILPQQLDTQNNRFITSKATIQTRQVAAFLRPGKHYQSRLSTTAGLFLYFTLTIIEELIYY